jgi:FeS assembly SUF system protein
MEDQKQATDTTPERSPEEAEETTLEERVVEVLKTCYDPEIPVDIHELGLIYKIDVRDDGEVEIDMTLTSPACPAAGSLPPEVEHKVAALEGVSSVKVNVVWEPVWTPEKMTEAARLQLGMF